MDAKNILILPGWQNSGPAHWQTRWEQRHGYVRVEQHEWMRPLRGDWIARLEDVLLSQNGPSILVAHSMGCMLTAAWAAHSKNTHLVQGALLVAPGDTECEALRDILPSWSPIVRQRLPFPSIMLGSTNDPYCTLDRAQGFAADWGSQFVNYGACGHINAESGLGDWPEGWGYLQQLQTTKD